MSSVAWGARSTPALRTSRAALTDLGGRDWQHLDDAVMSVVYPDHCPPEHTSSDPLSDRLNAAFSVLERHAALPAGLRHY
jgi:hypothetical protein